MFAQEKVLSGVISLLILRNLIDGPKHGYLLQKEISSDLKRNLPSGAIYILLKNLQKRKFVRSGRTVIIRGRKIRQYELSKSGKDFLIRHLEPLRIVDVVIHGLIQDIEQIEPS